MRPAGGFSLVELTAATALTLTLVAAIFSLTQASRGTSAAQGEAADLQQRTRVAVDTIGYDVMMAGAGSYLPDHAGPLTAAIPAVMPFRRGMTGSDPPGTFSSDTITVIYVPTTAAQSTLTADLDAGSQTMIAARVGTCPAGENVCSFAPGMTIVAFDSGGAFQIFTVAAVTDAASQVTTTAPASTRYRTGTPIVEAAVRTYTLKTDPSTLVPQLVRYDGTGNPEIPVLDHVVALTYDYGVPAAELVDGPWRPDAASPDRWDVDLLRIRTIGITIRIESALQALRGPAGVLFAHGGTAADPRSWVPDQALHFQVSPRNLSLRR